MRVDKSKRSAVVAFRHKLLRRCRVGSCLRPPGALREKSRSLRQGQSGRIGLLDGTLRFDEFRHSDNVFFALRVDGRFQYVHARAMSRTEEGVFHNQ
jgi:hypothetical protein